ncbi:MAG: sigma-70 family RNA polymerase sigma factor [Acidobacteriota bacterium]
MRNEAISRLVDRAKKGDEAATEELYRLHSRRVYSLCIRMVANQAEAEDLTQEIFLHAFRKIHTFRGEAAFSTWLYRLGVNVVLMRLRKKSHPVFSLEELTRPNGETIKRAEPADKTDHAGILVNRLLLRGAIDQLPSGFKRVILMHDMEGYNHREIAELTGRSVGNSKSQLHKARRRLRELLTQGPGMQPPLAFSKGKIE